MSKNCTNCAWYCHADGRCYGSENALAGYPDIFDSIIYDPHQDMATCSKWSFDGLEEEEREALMTMEMTE